MTFHLRPSVVTACAVLICSVASAKLPPPSAEAAAKAAEAAAKAAWNGKVANYQLCKSQDRVAAHYLRTAKDAKAPTPTAACADPGPFAYTPPSDKPVEASGAHSPAGTASSPPSTQAPAASAVAPKS